MKEIFKKLVDNGRKDALKSVENFKKAMKEFGYTEEEIEKALHDFPISDDDIEWVAGGNPRPSFPKSARPGALVPQNLDR